MTQPTLLINNVYAFEVPEGATRPYFDGVQSIGFMLDGELRFIHILPGSWQLMGATKEVTEDIAAQIVERDRGGFTGQAEGYKDYAPIGCDMEPFSKAFYSLQTLLASKALDPNKNYVLIKQIK